MVKVDLEIGDGDVDWDKDPYDDGFRPVSFLLETVEDE